MIGLKKYRAKSLKLIWYLYFFTVASERSKFMISFNCRRFSQSVSQSFRENKTENRLNYLSRQKYCQYVNLRL